LHTKLGNLLCLWKGQNSSGIWRVLLKRLFAFNSRLRNLAPELFRTTAQDAYCYNPLLRYRAHWCRHIAHVLLYAIQIQKIVILQGFCLKGSFSQRVRNLNNFFIITEIIIIFTHIIYDTSSWGLELIPIMHFTSILIASYIFPI
jgi:hypothetical protein